MDTEKKAQFDILLTAPPLSTGNQAIVAATDEDEGAMFLQFHSAVTGQVVQ